MNEVHVRELVPMAREIKVVVPHRISGFFEIVDHEYPVNPTLDDLSTIGSRGGGPCLSLGGITRILVDEKKDDEDYQIRINGKDCTVNARTTRSALRWLPGEIFENYSLKILHNYCLPIGAGYGSSGCGAVGSVVAMNVLFNLGMSLNQCGKIAHCAEVENKTGLGTVGGMINGGCTITMEPGYPFQLNSLIIPSWYKIACASKGGILTSDILSDEHIRNKIISAGKDAMKSIVKGFTIENFMKTSISFVKCTGMLDMEKLDLGGVKNIMEILNKESPEGILGASMNQLGKSVYCVYTDGQENENFIQETFKANGFTEIFFLEFNPSGPQVVDFISDFCD
ncbi:MAG: hypothetical protein ACFFCS_08115 [Candidatus Hodarchaeota archaeon]